MRHSGIAGYKRLRDTDPALCREIVAFSEGLAEHHGVDLAVVAVIKQAMCQFALDTLTRYATARVA